MKLFCIILITFISVLSISCSETQKEKPTLYAVGDSTVKNGYGDGAGGLWGWGDYIHQVLDSTQIRVENHALGGTSSRTYQDLGLWDSVYHKLKKNDYVLIQFGHNDDGPINDDFRARGTIKGIGNESEEIDNILTGKHEIVYSYGWYIRKIVTQTKEKGAIPVIMSPIPRNKWEDGKVPRNDKSYGLLAKQIAEEEKVTFVNLNGKMALEMEAVGEEAVLGNLFYKKDHTHPTAKGAILGAQLILGELRKQEHSLVDFALLNPSIVLPKKKNIFLIGDSTMADNDNENAVGWGVPFPEFVDTTRVAVHNKARGGRSSRTFDFEGLWDAAKSEFEEGDFVLLQFGHNDAGNIDKAKFRGSKKGIGDGSQVVKRNDSVTEIVRTFGWYMTKYIKETKEKGAIPIVLTQTPRNEWPQDKVERRDSTYNKWAEAVAKKENVSYLNLNDSIAVAYEKLGKESVVPFFPKDNTHTGADGAYFNAQVIARALKQLKGSQIRDYMLSKK